MEYVLTGFEQDRSIRLFAFDAIERLRPRRKFTVGVDVSVIGKYAISLQELPLLCRQLLEEQADTPADGRLMFTEVDMAGVAARRADAKHKLEQQKLHRKLPSGGRPGEAWRHSQPFGNRTE